MPRRRIEIEWDDFTFCRNRDLLGQLDETNLALIGEPEDGGDIRLVSAVVLRQQQSLPLDHRIEGLNCHIDL